MAHCQSGAVIQSTTVILKGIVCARGHASSYKVEIFDIFEQQMPLFRYLADRYLLNLEFVCYF